MSKSFDSLFRIIKNSKNNSPLFPIKQEKNNIIKAIKYNYFIPQFSHYSKRKKITEIIICFLSLISYLLYYLSLGGCDGTQTECLKNSNIAYYYLLVNYCFLSAGFISFIIVLILIKQVSKYHLIHMFIVYPILFLSDTGATLMNHGIYNIIGFTLFLICYCSLLLLIIFIQDLLINKSLKTKLIVINTVLLIIIFCRYLVHNSFKKECKDWDLGLNNTRIQDDFVKYPCQLKRPISCHINYFSKKQDLSKLLKLECSNNINSNQVINSRNLLIKYINRKEFEKTKRFGFPLTNTAKFKIDNSLTPETFTQKVFDNVIDIDNPPKDLKKEEYPEVTLNFGTIGNDYKEGDKSMKYMGKIDINIKRNETLSKERKAKEIQTSLFKNVLMIYTDAVSRAHFKRKMPKTCQFIENFMKNNFENDYNNMTNTNNLINNKTNIRNLGTKLKNKVVEKIKNNVTIKEIKKENKTNNQIIKNVKKKQIKIIGKSKKLKNKNKINKNPNKTIINMTKDINKDINFNKNNKSEINKLIKRKKYIKNLNLTKNKTNNINNITAKKINKIRNNKINISNIKNEFNKTNISVPKKTRIKNNINIINKINKLKKIRKTNNNINDKYYAYQFLKYHTFTSGTKFNAMPMFFGQSVYNVKATNIIKDFKQLGYITAQSTDMCSKEVWEPEKEPPGIDFDFWDHENVAMFCDPSYMDRKSLYSIYKGVYSLLRRCFYGKEVHDYIFEYGTKFWEAYPDNKKFLRLGFNDGHESTFEVLQYLDEPMYNFLNTFYTKGYLKDTALFIISDHGNHMPGLYNLFLSEQYETERVLGNFYIIINSNILFNEQQNIFRFFNKNVMENQQSLTTPYDIYNTLNHIIYGTTHNNRFTIRGESVFLQMDNLKRDCNFFDQDDEEKGLCKCVSNDKYEKFVYYKEKF